MKAPAKLQQLIEAVGAAGTNEPLPPPSAGARRVMAKHLQEHGRRDFRLARDVFLGGGEKRRPSQLLTWDPVGARFWCGDPGCAGIVFLTGELTSEVLAHTQRWDEGLRPHLAGLATPEERDEMTRRYLTGEINRERLRDLRKSGPRRRSAASSRPQVAERRRQVQEWMLERMAACGVLERVLDEAERLQRKEPDAWLRLAHRPLGRPALRRYWYDLDPQVRAQAREASSLGDPPPRT